MLEIPFRPRARLNALSLYGLTGLVTSILVHLGSYTRSAIRPEHPLFWGLHVGLFPLFFLMVWRLRAWQGRRRGVLGLGGRQLRWRELLAYFPPWARVLATLLFLYVGVNFFVAISHLPTGATVTMGEPVTPERARYTVRAFSGHWLVFYGLPTLFFLFVPRDARPPEITSEAAV